MAFVRTEVKQAITKFRDAIAGVAISLLGTYWALNGLGFMAILGTSMAVAGALLVFAGIQRGRFKSDDDGPGVVHVDEGQVTYFGPLDGGSVVVADISRVELVPSADGKAHWILYDPATEPLQIPTDADGAQALFDVFSGLDGLQTEKMLALLNSPRKKHEVIWRANRPLTRV